MLMHKKETSRSSRVLVLVDESNVGSSVRTAGRGLDWLKLRDYLLGSTSGRELIEMVVYAGLPPAIPLWQDERDKKNKFVHWLRSNGFMVVTKDGAPAEEGHYKANVDVMMAIDALELSNQMHPDVVILVTGDADFAYLATQLRRSGVRVEVASVAQNLGNVLKAAANAIIDLAPLFRTFELKAPPESIPSQGTAGLAKHGRNGPPDRRSMGKGPPDWRTMGNRPPDRRTMGNRPPNRRSMGPLVEPRAVQGVEGASEGADPSFVIRHLRSSILTSDCRPPLPFSVSPCLPAFLINSSLFPISALGFSMSASVKMSRLEFSPRSPSHRVPCSSSDLPGLLHNEVRTPLFMPVGTHATVKAQLPQTLEDAGSQNPPCEYLSPSLAPGTGSVSAALAGFMAFRHELE